MTVQVDQIPDCLRQLQQWVCWRYENTGKPKLDKIPYNPKTGRRASTTNPKTWGSFEDTCRAASQYNGIGFCLSETDGYTGVDLDAAIGQDGQPEPWAQGIINRLSTYAELSPSKTGVHIWVNAAKNHEKCKKPYEGGIVEVYDRGRFLTVTGSRLPDTPATIENRQAELDTLCEEVFGRNGKDAAAKPEPASVLSLSDTELIERAHAAKDSAKFAALWRGDTGGYASASEADAALCMLLAFWTGRDADRMDRLFRQSGLYRDKWERRDYSAGTIEHAIELTTDVYSPTRNGNGGRDQVRGPDRSEQRENSGSPSPRVGKAECLLAAARASITKTFRTPEGIGYAVYRWYGRTCAVPIVSVEFKHFLRELNEQVTEGRTIGRDSLTTVCDYLESDTARGEVEELYLRVAGCNGNVYLDLANERGEVVEITAQGWKVIVDPPVTFCRRPGMLPLPCPVPGGSLDMLKPLVNVSGDSWVLLVAFIVGCVNPKPPYPLLAVYGEQGSGKSTLTKIVKNLLDPAVVLARSAPEDAKAVIAAARNTWLLNYTNLSHMPPWFSDLLCCMSTDGGYSTRTLYETLEETTFDGRRPVCVNGIVDLINRSDLLDRSIQITLDPIPEDRRLDEETFWAEFEAVRPKSLGAICDAVSCAVRRKHEVKLDRTPRMADFAKWVVAAEDALPWPVPMFLSAYSQNREEAHEQAVEADRFASLVLDFARSLDGEWQGTATDLYDALKPAIDPLPEWFPADAARLGKRLTRIAPNLRALGCDIRRKPGTKRGRIIRWLDGNGRSLDARSAGLDGKRDGELTSLDGTDGKSNPFTTLSVGEGNGL